VTIGFPVIPGTAGAVSHTWRDRRGDAAYTSPSGTRAKFEYFDLSRETPLRTAQFDFPGINNSYIQQNGFGSREYPLRCIFWGGQSDLEATFFETMLLEKGVGRLEHPMYGTFNVVPVGRIVRRDAPKTEANQSSVEVTFFTTTGTVYPSAGTNPQADILSTLGGFDIAVAQQYSASCDISTVVKKQNLLATVKKGIATVEAELSEISSAVTTVDNAFHDAVSTLNYGLDVLVGEPLQLALQVSNLIKAPGRALTGIGSRLDAYGNLASTIFGSSAGHPENVLSVGQALSSRTTKASNDFHTASLFAMCSVGGMINAAIADPIGPTTPASTVSSQSHPLTGRTFQTKPQAMAAASQILALFDSTVAWRDAGFQALGGVDAVSVGQLDTGEAYQALREAAARAAGFLVDVSFSLLSERVIVLDRNRTIVDLAAEIYGAVDSRLDFLIETNNLSGDEILELPAGRSILYYPS
jgi:hypothetical protein